MHAVLVHNPTAGSGSHRAEALTSLLKEAGYSVTACSTKECVYKEALKEQADLVLIAGGTRRQVFTALQYARSHFAAGYR
jgi:diacylglycerol kinase family enzyme